MTPSHSHPDNTPGQTPDQTIARVLHALRDTHAPTGLEDRIARRLRHAAEAPPAASASIFAVILNAVKDPRSWLATRSRYSLAVTSPLTFALPALSFVLILLSLLTARLLHRTPTTLATNSTHPQPTTHTPQPPQLATTHTSHHPPPPREPTTYNVQPPTTSPADQLALEETLAPSLYAPPMPLTAQERLLLRVTRPGSAIEVAELDQLREPILRAAAAARDRARLQHYADGIIAPLLAFPNPDPIPDTPNPTPEDTPPPPK